MKRIAVINMSKVRKMMLEASLITKVGIYLSFLPWACSWLWGQAVWCRAR
ncbi:hypothetical protein [Paenibacillus larvae]|nr:hypothetical protein [Paenibacillus larvae]MDT2193890.1 hypothetical protein [Paenibacillus larvae]MDT2238610.1 hypothetical protein [Paenibacillus larvae]MDT2241205.1 hypothetical protein [Paenibacillus larvae]MDT2248974.1 hypothetical protein [Paenibacillus larvae]MDT2277111.1 hypothetical protein [Paenibacillus larvae]